jgi:acetyl esterase
VAAAIAHDGCCSAVILAGDSAGGNLAAAVASSLRQRGGGGAVLGQLLVYPVTDCTTTSFPPAPSWDLLSV